MNNITEIEYKKIKNKLGNNDYRLGLDLGVGSIGYCAIALKDDDNGEKSVTDNVVLLGSRIFKASSGAVDRRQKRGQRNNHRHNRERKRFLWNLLASKNLALEIPKNIGKKEDSSEEETSKKRFPIETLKKDPYTLRYKALEEQLENYDLGYVIYHIANHRGTASVRTFLEDDETTRKDNTETARIADNIKSVMKSNGYRTYGEFLYKEYIQKTSQEKRVKVTNSNNKVFAVTRDLILEELKIILEKQRDYANLTDEYIEKLIKAVDYETEKLIPEIGTCPYFREERRLPKAHKLNEYRRIYEALNNSRFFVPVTNLETGEITSFTERHFFDDIVDNKFPFKEKERDVLFNYLLGNKKLTAAKAQSLLKLPSGTEIQLQGKDKSKQEIKGYTLNSLEEMPFWNRLSEELKDEFLYDWNSSPDERQLKKKLLEIYNLSEQEIDECFKKLVISSSYADIGKKAMEIILPYIKKGLSYNEAIGKAIEDKKLPSFSKGICDLLPYYGKILQESTQKVIAKGFSNQFRNKNYKTPNTNKDELKYGKIANPVVHQTLNELRKLVNEIITIFGKKPYDITIETSRELKKSQQARIELVNEQKDNERKKKNIYDTYIVPHIAQIKSKKENPLNYILRFELFDEQNKRCPYCLKTLEVDDIISGKAEIEHIFPLSLSEDDSKNNKVLSCSDCNATKGERAPYDAFAHLTEGKFVWNNILSNLLDENNNKNFRNKAWRFYQGSFEKFLENKPMNKRFTTDNSYISKTASKYLNSLYDKPTKIFPVKGFLTSQLRLAWGINGVLIPFAKELLTEKEQEKLQKELSQNKKIRIDNRHHALDALVLAFASRGYHNFINTINSKGYKINYKEKNWLSKILLPPTNKTVEEFNDFIKNKIPETNISIKHDHDKNGQLFKETIYQTYYLNNSKSTLVSVKNVKDIDFPSEKEPKERLETVLCKYNIKDTDNEKLKEKIRHNVEKYNQIIKILPGIKERLESENIILKNEGKKEKKITEQLIFKSACEYVSGKYYQIETKLNNKFYSAKNPIQNKTGFGYDTGDNLCLDLYYDSKGKLCGEVIRKANFLAGQTPEYKKNGYALFERIYQGDILEVDQSDKKWSLKNKTNSAPKNRVFVKVATFTELNAYYEKGKRDQIQIYICNILKADQKHDDSFYISSMQEYNPRKVILSSLGIIKYRSAVLKDKNVENN